MLLNIPGPQTCILSHACIASVPHLFTLRKTHTELFYWPWGPDTAAASEWHVAHSGPAEHTWPLMTACLRESSSRTDTGQTFSNFFWHFLTLHTNAGIYNLLSCLYRQLLRATVTPLIRVMRHRVRHGGLVLL